MTDSWTEDDLELAEPDREAIAKAEREKPTPTASAHTEEVRRDVARREQLRQEELEHLAQLRSLVQAGLDHGEIDTESGVAMLLNISKARLALGGIGVYPGAW